jgi:hypothetical protein
VTATTIAPASSAADIQPKLVSVEKARSLLGDIGKTRLYEYFYTGDLTRVKVGARTCVTVESIDRLVSRCMAGAA